MEGHRTNLSCLSMNSGYMAPTGAGSACTRGNSHAGGCWHRALGDLWHPSAVTPLKAGESLPLRNGARDKSPGRRAAQPHLPHKCPADGDEPSSSKHIPFNKCNFLCDDKWQFSGKNPLKRSRLEEVPHLLRLHFRRLQQSVHQFFSLVTEHRINFHAGFSCLLQKLLIFQDRDKTVP